MFYNCKAGYASLRVPPVEEEEQPEGWVLVVLKATKAAVVSLAASATAREGQTPRRRTKLSNSSSRTKLAQPYDHPLVSPVWPL